MTDIIERYFILSDYEPKSMLSGMVLALSLKKLALDVKIYRFNKIQEEQTLISKALEELEENERVLNLLIMETKISTNKIKTKRKNYNRIINELSSRINGLEETKKITEKQTLATEQIKEIINKLKEKKEEIIQRKPQNYKLPKIIFLTEEDFEKINFNEQTENRVYYFVSTGDHYYTVMFQRGDDNYKIISTESIDDVLPNEINDRFKNLNVAAEGDICETKAFMDIILFERCLIFNQNCEKLEEKITLLNKIVFNSIKSGKDIKFDSLNTFKEIYKKYEKDHSSDYYDDTVETGFQYPMIKKIIEIFKETSELFMDEKYGNLKKVFAFYSDLEIEDIEIQQSLGQWVMNVLNEELYEEDHNLEEILAKNNALELFEEEKGKELFLIILEKLNKEKNIKQYFKYAKSSNIDTLNKLIQEIKELSLPDNEEIELNKAVICNFKPSCLSDLEKFLEMINRINLMNNEATTVSEKIINKMDIKNLSLDELLYFTKLLNNIKDLDKDLLNEKIVIIKEVVCNLRCSSLSILKKTLKSIEELSLTNEEVKELKKAVVLNFKPCSPAELEKVLKLIKELNFGDNERIEVSKKLIDTIDVKGLILGRLLYFVEILNSVDGLDEEFLNKQRAYIKDTINNFKPIYVSELEEVIKIIKELNLKNKEEDEEVSKIIMSEIIYKISTLYELLCFAKIINSAKGLDKDFLNIQRVGILKAICKFNYSSWLDLKRALEIIKELNLTDEKEKEFTKIVICNFELCLPLDLKEVFEVIKELNLMNEEKKEFIEKILFNKIDVKWLALCRLSYFIKIVSNVKDLYKDSLNGKIADIKEVIFNFNYSFLSDLNEVFEMMKELGLTKEEEKKFTKTAICNFKISLMSDLKKVLEIIDKLDLINEEKKELNKTVIGNFKPLWPSELKKSFIVIEKLNSLNKKEKEIAKMATICNFEPSSPSELEKHIKIIKKLKFGEEEKSLITGAMTNFIKTAISLDNFNEFYEMFRSDIFFLSNSELVNCFVKKCNDLNIPHEILSEMENELKDNLKKNEVINSDYDCVKPTFPKSTIKSAMEDDSDGGEEVEDRMEENSSKELSKTQYVEKLNQQRLSFGKDLGIV